MVVSSVFTSFKSPFSPLSGQVVCDIMKALVLIAMIMAVLILPVMSEEANMSFTSKSFNVASGGTTPYFYGTATNNTSIMFFMPGKGQQRDTLYWLNLIPINSTVHVTYDNFVISDIKTNLTNGTWY
jgi:hypothetical protein